MFSPRQSFGIRGLLVRTGKFRAASLDRAAGRPEAVIESVAALPGWLGVAPIDDDGPVA